MCEGKAGGPGGVDARALCHFRFFVYREYGEIRHLRRDMVGGWKFEEQADRCTEIAVLDEEGGHKRELARRLYFDTVGLSEPAKILEAYQKEHGLSLENLEEIFQADVMGSALGGPAHASIVRETIRLGQGIEADDLDEAMAAVDNLRNMSHNTRLAILDFRDLNAQGRCCVSPG